MRKGCLCGCGEVPQEKNSVFCQGHDARAVWEIVSSVYGGAEKFVRAHKEREKGKHETDHHRA